MDILLLSAKINEPSISEKQVRSKIEWCEVHADGVVRIFDSENFKERSKDQEAKMASLFRNKRLSLTSTKSYSNLCLIVGFIHRFISFRKFPSITLQDCNERIQFSGCSLEVYLHPLRRQLGVARDEYMKAEGEKRLRENLGGTSSDNEDIFTVRRKSWAHKSYNSSRLKEAHGIPLEKNSRRAVQDEKLYEMEQNAAFIPLYKSADT